MRHSTLSTSSFIKLACRELYFYQLQNTQLKLQKRRMLYNKIRELFYLLIPIVSRCMKK